MNDNGEHDATVKTLTAEVRVLMVGSRQVTLSVYRQLDWVDPADITPFGRVNAEKEPDEYFTLTVVGSRDGMLVRSSMYKGTKYCDGELRKCSRYREPDHQAGHLYDSIPYGRERWDAWAQLPLIVLAGLR